LDFGPSLPLLKGGEQMRTNGDFGKFLYDLKPQNHPALLAFYNYIRTYSDLDSPFLPETVFNFYVKALSFEHWQQNAIEFSQITYNALFRFLGADINSKAWAKLKRPEHFQIIKIKNSRDQLETIKQYLHTEKPNIASQIFHDKNNISHAVMILPKGNIQVRTFNDQAFLHNGRIIPLIQDRKLEYTKNLELVPDLKQQIQVSNFVTANFTVKSDMIVGDYIRGYSLQSFQRIELHGFHQDSNILYALKKIERFFIDRSTEPLYVELIQVLEQTIDFLKRGINGSHELGKKAYIRGQNALENIFVDDKMLEVLLNDIKTYIGESNPKETAWNQKTSFESTNTFHNRGSAPEEPQID
jgi:hypothetical protein